MELNQYTAKTREIRAGLLWVWGSVLQHSV